MARPIRPSSEETGLHANSHAPQSLSAATVVVSTGRAPSWPNREVSIEPQWLHTTGRGGPSMPTMRAMTVAEAGASLRMIEQEVPEPWPGEVRLRLRPAVCARATLSPSRPDADYHLPRARDEVIGTLEAVGTEYMAGRWARESGWVGSVARAGIAGAAAAASPWPATR